jgi:hypothetical protein
MAEKKPDGASKAAPKATRADRLLALAMRHYEPHRATRWPYLLREGRQLKFEGPDKLSLRADLGALWRQEYRDESTPSDRDVSRVINDLLRLAEKAAPDEPGPDDVAAGMVTAAGVTPGAGVDPGDAASSYEVRKGMLGWWRPVREGGMVWTPLATFDARITEEVMRDDGAELALTWRIQVDAADGRKGEVVITPDQLGRPQQWAATAVGMSALVMPGLSIADHLRVAVHSRSTDVPRKTVYAHTGWRRAGGRWAYLTSSGATTSKALDTSVAVDLGTLGGYELPAVRSVRDVRGAVRKSLALADIAPDKVMVPILAAVYRAPLPLPPDCAVWLYGRSGTYKTAITAVAQQHYGATMDAGALPGNWTSTANALEAQAFTLDGALFTVDDFSPDASRQDAQRRASAADRLIRGAANHSARDRLRPDGTRRPAKPPRAQILTSAEDIPPGVESMRARTMVAEISPGDVTLPRLAKAQAAAADGSLALALAGYVQWLARRYDADGRLPDLLGAERGRMRDSARAEGHPRHALNIGSLALGWHEFLAFAEHVGAIDAEQRAAMWTRVWRALADVGAEQERYGGDVQPWLVYLRSLAALIASGRACLVNLHGQAPANGTRWGWWWDESGDGSFRTRGDIIGWVDGDDVFLQPDAAYNAARRFADGTPAPLAVTKYAVHKMLHERGVLLTTGKSGRLTIRKRTLAGNPTVLHIAAKSLEAVDEHDDEQEVGGLWAQNREHREHREQSQVRPGAERSRPRTRPRTSAARPRTLALRRSRSGAAMFAVSTARTPCLRWQPRALTCRFQVPFAMFAMFAVSSA